MKNGFYWARYIGNTSSPFVNEYEVVYVHTDGFSVLVTGFHEEYHIDDFDFGENPQPLERNGRN